MSLRRRGSRKVSKFSRLCTSLVIILVRELKLMHGIGLNVERAMNNNIEEYLLDNQYEGRGLLIYIPRPVKSTILEEEVQKQERKKLRIQQGLSPDEEEDPASEFPDGSS